jgi:hypothetical protein
MVCAVALLVFAAACGGSSDGEHSTGGTGGTLITEDASAMSSGGRSSGGSSATEGGTALDGSGGEASVLSFDSGSAGGSGAGGLADASSPALDAHPCGITHSDPWNCGECGRECFNKTTLGCFGGECQAGLSPCADVDSNPTRTCNDICSFFGVVCVPAACRISSGDTPFTWARYYEPAGSPSCESEATTSTPMMQAASCDTPIDQNPFDPFGRVRCCCL